MTDELRAKVDELEQRIETLEEQLDESASDAAESDLLDRYDRQAIKTLENVSAAQPRAIMRAYKRAGVVNKKKQKQRAKRLKELAVEGEIE